MIPLYIKTVKAKGRGVFSYRKIEKGCIVEICPLLIFTTADVDFLLSTFIKQYCFSFIEEKNEITIAMGFGCLYNHACPANAHHFLNTDKKIMTITALTTIKPHTEILINYNGAFNDEKTEWFTNRNIEIKK